MNLRVVFFLVVLIFFVIVLVSYQDGPANRSGSGFTGAPGEDGRVCENCHLSGFYSLPQTILTLEDALTGQIHQSYKPGREYIITLQVNSSSLGNGSNPRYGMQMTALDEDKMDIGRWSLPSNNAQISYAEVSNTTQMRAYVEHRFPSFTKTFSARWTAPLCTSDTLTFHHIGNAVNGDGEQSGDRGGKGDSTKIYPEIVDFLTFDQNDTL